MIRRDPIDPSPVPRGRRARSRANGFGHLSKHHPGRLALSRLIDGQYERAAHKFKRSFEMCLYSGWTIDTAIISRAHYGAIA